MAGTLKEEKMYEGCENFGLSVLLEQLHLKSIQKFEFLRSA